MVTEGQIKSVYDNKCNRWENAKIINIRKDVTSSFDNYIYPILYDVQFVHDGRISKGHLPFAVRQ
jgi:hypothetical protein